MAFDNTVTIVGNVTRDPELRYLTSGTALTSFGVAWNNRYKDRNGDQVEDTSFFDVTCWRDLADHVAESISNGDALFLSCAVWRQAAENVAESVGRGTRVTVAGRLDQRSWETPEGDKRSKVEIVADDVAPSLRWATAQVTKVPRGEGPSSGGGGYSEPPRTEPPAYDDAEEPF